MANTLPNPTQGFQSFGRIEGASPTAGMTPVWIASTDATLIFRGDLVVTSTAPGTNNSGAYITSMQLSNPSSGFLVRGIFQGCYQYQPNVGRVVWSNFYNGIVTGSTGDVKAYIIDDPDQLFLAFASTNAAVASSQIGCNISVSTGLSSQGNTTTGFSNVTLQATSINSASSFPFRLVDLYSAVAPTGGFGIVNAGASATNIVNGTDNGNPANIVVVRLNYCDRLTTTSRST